MESRLTIAQRYVLMIMVCIVVLALFPLTLDPSIDIKVLVYQLGAFLLVTLWLFKTEKTSIYKQRLVFLHALFFAFIIIHFISAAFSINPGFSVFRDLARWTALYALFLITADVIRSPRHAWTLISVLCITMALASLYGVIQSMGMDPVPWSDARRVQQALRAAPSTFGNPNLASHVLTPTVILALGLLTQKRGRWVIFCIPFFLYHYTLTQTRGSILALTGSIIFIVLILLISKRVKKPAYTFLFTLGVLLCIALAGIAVLAIHLENKTGQPFAIDVSTTLRYHSFDGACRMIQDRPIFGHGPGMFIVATPAYWTPLEQERFSSQNAMNFNVHNEPLEIGVNAGLFAAILYLSMLFIGMYYAVLLGLAKQGLPGHRPLGIVLAGFYLAFMIDGFFGFNVHVPVSGMLLFMLSGVLAGVWKSNCATLSDTSLSPTLQTKISPGEHTTAENPKTWLPFGRRLVIWGFVSVFTVLGIRDFAGQFYHQRGLGALEQEKYVDAADAFRKASLYAPFNWLHPYYLGIVARETGNIDNELVHLSRTLKLNPNYLHAQFRIAEATFNLATQSSGDQEHTLINQTVEYAQRAAQFNPLDPRVHDVLGRASFLQARQHMDYDQDEPLESSVETWKEVEHHLQTAIDLGSSDQASLYRFIAIARFSRQDMRGAQRALIDSLDEAPTQEETWQAFYQIAQTTEQYDALMHSLEWHLGRMRRPRSDTDADDWIRLQLLRARVLHEGYHEGDNADDIYLDITENFPTRVKIWSEYHTFTQETAQEDRFIQLFYKSSKRWEDKKDIPPVLLATAKGLEADGEYIMEATSMLMNALQRDQAAQISSEQISTTYAWAARVLSKQAQEIPLNQETRGDILLKLGLVFGVCSDYTTSLQLLETALPDLTGEHRMVCLLQMGEAYLLTEEPVAAVKVLEQAARLDPTYFEARYSLAKALVQAGQRARARLEYTDMLSRFELSDEGRLRLQQELDMLME